MAVQSTSFSTTGLQLWTNDRSEASVWGNITSEMIAWLGEICNPVLGAITPGSGYLNETYPDVELVRPAAGLSGGRDMLAEVVIAGNSVTSVTITQKGNGFKTGDYLVFKDLAQVGGQGSGFQVEVTSANASIGLVKDPFFKTADDYVAGWTLGLERTDRYSFGAWIHKNSNAYQTYFYPMYGFDSSGAANEGYGDWSNNQTPTNSSWYDSSGDGYTVQVIYCADAGNRFFLTSDSRYDDMWGLVELNQNDGATYPDRDLVSPWSVTDCAAAIFRVNPCVSYAYATNFIGVKSNSELELPYDANSLFNKQSIMGRSIKVGDMPDRVCSHANITSVLMDTLSSGADVWTRLTNVVWIRTSA
ncbi:MAG: hypothetical protein GY918_13150 [Gammaproteobacteria bacterium]|nr:hypothetical protein [Gammaproteobacteria bacterium]